MQAHTCMSNIAETPRMILKLLMKGFILRTIYMCVMLSCEKKTSAATTLMY